MKATKITLTNEHGKDIVIRTLKDKKPDCTYVLLSISSPLSMGEWVITEKEGKALHEALGEALK